ncbi:hypothetical protein MUU72_27345 [Streptomyces sp. RS10V-4]|uniref:hypothetical protein n=1 Tax=Streptomyces rhizoryzae TaxID=2932493 RepID=UPI0020049026|nr:hypothetical protein [Streptomyces rhizoryzae]MCK7626772.1 hypothetical protein [Streptomyces rhizoryzae]
MSFNQPPPGPYGQQPPQPGPYGQPQPPAPQPGYGYPPQGGQVPPPQGYGYPQQGGQAPPPQGYGYPQQAPQQQPYGQPAQSPYGQQAPYGGQQTPYGTIPQEPEGGGNGKKIGLIIGAVVVVAAIGVGAYFAFGSGGQVKPYTMVMPDKLLNGQFSKDTTGSPMGGTSDFSNDKDAKKFGITNGKGVGGKYKDQSGLGMSVSGVYGQVADPQGTVTQAFAQLNEGLKNGANSPKVEDVTPPTEYSPSDFDGTVMKCETKKLTYSASGMSVPVTASVCMWGDNSALGVVTMMAAPNPNGGGSATTPSAEQLAEKTAKIRNEVRKEK